MMSQKIEYENYLEDVQGLFPMPKIMAEIGKRLKSDDTTIDDLGELVMSDATLVANIVKLSNSSYFSFAEKSEDLNEAMQRIGLRELSRLVGACVAEQVYQVELRHYRISPDAFWESGVSGALLMERLAEALRLDTGAAYIAGLMREAGMLVIDYALGSEGLHSTWNSSIPIYEWERQTCGHDHMEVGGALLTVWGFPEEVCSAVASQWSDDPIGEGLSGLINLVNRLLACCGHDFSKPIKDYAAFSGLIDSLGLDADRVAKGIGEAAKVFDRLKSGVLEQK